MRLFVAIELDETVTDAAARLVEELERRAHRLAPRSRITWVAPDRMHVTVRFIGEVDSARLEPIRGALEAPVPVAPFTLHVRGIGTFPGTGEPRVVWAGLESGRDQLIAVEREVTARLSRVGIEPEERPYNPHLTLGRVRTAAGLRAQKLLEAVSETVLGASPVRAITLVESRLSSAGPSYAALLRTPLQAGSEAHTTR